MDVTDALKAMTVIEGRYDGTEASAELVKALYEKLLCDPENFWEEFLTMVSNTLPNEVRDLAEKMIRSGEIEEHSTIADVKAALERHLSVKK